MEVVLGYHVLNQSESESESEDFIEPQVDPEPDEEQYPGHEELEAHEQGNGRRSLSRQGPIDSGSEEGNGRRPLSRQGSIDSGKTDEDGDLDDTTALLHKGRGSTSGLRVTIQDLFGGIRIGCLGGASPAEERQRPGAAGSSDGTELQPIANSAARNDYKWPRRSSKFLLKVPHDLRQANPEAFQPRLFHFGPHASHFFEFPPPAAAPNSTWTDNSDSCSRAFAIPDNSDFRIKEIMVEDLMGQKTFDLLVKKIADDQMLFRIMDFYPEIRHMMNSDNIPALTLAKRFASSAAIIMSSLLLYGNSSSDDMAMEVTIHNRNSASGSESLTMRHSTLHQYYAILDAVMVMDNQITILLLKLACEVFCSSEDRLYDFAFKINHELMGLHSTRNYSGSNAGIHISAMRLLVYMLRKCLKFLSSFHVAQSIWTDKQLRRTREWIDLYHGKPLIAYVYDCLVGRLSNDDGATESHSHTGIDMPTPHAADKQNGCG